MVAGRPHRSLNMRGQASAKLTHPFPHSPLCGSWIEHDCDVVSKRIVVLRLRVIRRPAAVSIGGKRNPRRMHCIGELLRSVASQKRTRHRLELFVESVEDEGNLAAELVTDVVVLQAGDNISAALRLLRCLQSR